MFSLLPSEEKKKIRREYFLRLGIVFLCFSFFSILLASFLIIPLYMLTHGMRKALTQEAAILENSPNLKEAEVIKKTLRESKDKIAVLSSESEQREVGGLVAASLQKRKGLAIRLPRLIIRERETRLELLHSKGSRATEMTSLLSRSGLNRIRFGQAWNYRSQILRGIKKLVFL